MPKQEVLNKVEETATKLLKWIDRVSEKPTSGAELALLPEVVKATSELLKFTR